MQEALCALIRIGCFHLLETKRETITGEYKMVSFDLDAILLLCSVESSGKKKKNQIFKNCEANVRMSPPPYRLNQGQTIKNMKLSPMQTTLALARQVRVRTTDWLRVQIS